ncbi:guanylate kinase [Desulfatibacillum alkenivorans DSM 16219]|uniref:Guanylate kinase n=1 Tax=Desulfatibacillum alkenivorans DSM 16219 TaxID=1121393 RepID=A0A1M6IKZ3_9BACT|nr:guanylate kinase [Desulfatibacillum alkenivorans]SHJ35069.1 guanylate kinase [Desulfatibacillum alkenivorans DSM 16219]
MSPNSRGRLFIMSAPSGAGKTTLREALCARQPNLAYSVSHTTRPPRQGEKDGVDYNFTSKEDFLQGIEEERWAEWAEVHGNYYGTSARFIARCLDRGCFVLLDIDVQGTEKILKRFPQAVTLFIMAPSMEVLEQRLSSRGTDAPEVIAKRLENAKGEMKKRSLYKHILVNDDLETAINELEGVVLQYGAPPPCPEAERRS